MSTYLEIFLELYEPLVYFAPGSASSTQRALAAAGPLPASADILDIGCGPGRQTLQLAAATQGSVTAVDNSRSSLETLAKRSAEAGIAARVRAVRASMDKLCFAQNTFDLIWSEGAIYCMGFAQGLESWRPHLRAGGTLAMTELSWLTNDPPEQTRAFWNTNYPGMSQSSQNRDAIASAGFELIEEFVLPESDWWDNYYADLEERIETFAEGFEGADRKIAEAVVEASRTEIDILRHSRGSYGYVFYISRKPN